MNCGSLVETRASGKAVWGGAMSRRVSALALLVMATVAASCGDVIRQGTGSSYLIVNALEGSSGAEPGTFTATLNSDVVTVVEGVPTIFNDLGRARLRLAMKDVGTGAVATTPTTNNFITINRYHVRFVRADGRNTPGVDVPYPFDGAVTTTIGVAEVTIPFELVRHVAKQEAPLASLARNPTVISTIAEVTFYGLDQTGHEASVMAQMLVSFGNFGDPGGG